MIVTIVHVKVKPEHVDDFKAASRANHEGSVKEPGNHRFDVLQSADDPTVFVLYEAYASQADVAFHKTTAHYAAWRDAVAPYMSEPRKGVPYVSVCP